MQKKCFVDMVSLSTHRKRMSKDKCTFNTQVKITLQPSRHCHTIKCQTKTKHDWLAHVSCPSCVTFIYCLGFDWYCALFD